MALGLYKPQNLWVGRRNRSVALADSWEAELLLGLRRLMDDGLIRRVVVVVVLNYGAFLFNQLIRRGTLDQRRLLKNYRGVSAL